MANLINLFLRQAQAAPGQIALIHGAQRLTFAALAADMQARAAVYRRRGIRQGDRVLVLVRPGPDFFRSVLALFFMGAVVVVTDDVRNKARLAWFMSLAPCVAVVGDWKVRWLRILLSPLRHIPLFLSKGLSGCPQPNALPQKLPDTAPALITFTTGSTGQPKVRTRSHGFLRRQFERLSREIGQGPGEADMGMLPIVLLVNLGIGATTVIPDYRPGDGSLQQRKALLHLFRREQVSRLTGSPWLMQALAAGLDERGETAPQVKTILMGGAPVFPEDARLLLRVFPCARIRILYGSSEAEPMALLDASELAGRDVLADGGLLVGTPDPDLQMWILPPVNSADGAGPELGALAEGRHGEVAVAGNSVLRTNGDALTTDPLFAIPLAPEQAHRTGDGGFIREGRLFLTGRVGPVHETGIPGLSPLVVEGLLRRLPGITGGLAIQLEGHPILVVETALAVIPPLGDLAGYPWYQVIPMTRIPRDRRHFAKYDRPALLKKLRRRLRLPLYHQADTGYPGAYAIGNFL